MKTLFKARKIDVPENFQNMIIKDKVYDIYYDGYDFCTTDEQGIKYRISHRANLNRTWEIVQLDSEDDKFREVLLSEDTV